MIAFARLLLTALIAATVALQSSAQTESAVDYGEDALSPNWIFKDQEHVRTTYGGKNSNWHAQRWVCTSAEFDARTGDCARLPADASGELEYGLPVLVDGDIREWLGSAWQPRPGNHAKTTNGLKQWTWTKRTPGQGVLLSLKMNNSAQGDSGVVWATLTDAVGAQAGGDEGAIAFSAVLRDWESYVAIGSTVGTLSPGQDTFVSNVVGKANGLHDDQVAPRRLLVWTYATKIPFTVSQAGENPKANPPDNGASWIVDDPLSFSQLPGSMTGEFGIERTDWCATLDATRRTNGQYTYLLVSRFNTPQQFTTFRLSQGQNVGIYGNEFVKGYATADTAVNGGNVEGHLIPCAVIADYDNATSRFRILPIVDTQVGNGWLYHVPAEGSRFPQGMKITLDNSLGASGARNGYIANTMNRTDSRGGQYAFGAWGKWEVGFRGTAGGALLRDERLFHPATEYDVLELWGRSSWPGNQLRVVYEENQGKGAAKITIPHVGSDSYFVIVKRGNGAPVGPCAEPGLERYYDLDSDEEYTCDSQRAWSCKGFGCSW